MEEKYDVTQIWPGQTWNHTEEKCVHRADQSHDAPNIERNAIFKPIMTGLADIEEYHVSMRFHFSSYSNFYSEQEYFVRLNGHRSADGPRSLFSSHMTPLVSSPYLHSASWTSFPRPTSHPLCNPQSAFLWGSDWTREVLATVFPKRAGKRHKQVFDTWSWATDQLCPSFSFTQTHTHTLTGTFASVLSS